MISRPCKFPQSDLDMMQELRDDNFTIRDIADKFDCSIGLVSQYTKKQENKMSIIAASNLYDDGGELTKETIICHGRKPIGRFIPF